ncbi:hypothetical protein [Leucobacter exalbidus]|uniref:hypothetical protein n=1 Tax=Leucobacter exalbidus TaxID=662960 RepID=UPI003158B72E
MLRLLLAAETLGLIALVAFTIMESFAQPGAVAQEVSLVLMAVAALVWVGLTFFGVARSQASWARGSSVTIHVLAFAAGTGCLQLGIGQWWLGLGIVLVALIGFAAAVIARPERSSEAA